MNMEWNSWVYWSIYCEFDVTTCGWQFI